MKITIDREQKLIKIEEKVNLNDFIKELDELLPNNKWKEYSLECTYTQNIWNPPFYERPYYNDVPVTYCSTATGTYPINSSNNK